MYNPFRDRTRQYKRGTLLIAGINKGRDLIGFCRHGSIDFAGHHFTPDLYLNAQYHLKVRGKQGSKPVKYGKILFCFAFS